ncbi:hypothetical protein AVEN_102549-1 [Araneus ventricosus]|uniref:Uncharacterized protein n=1 Tax=Araneus ventricosus TaxID=182803 RepID=A0A4Y2BIB8_ARAVE|nr:hypothetical protein AVEN_102549-1 [Araneus ventricosus]
MVNFITKQSADTVQNLRRTTQRRSVSATGAQSKYFSKTKDELIEGTAIILANFSENYTCIMQDAIQSVHWKKEQVTIHPFLAYVKDTANDELKPILICVISDHLVHDSITFWTFQKVIDQDLIKEVIQIKYIKYFSDGSSAQYKNFKLYKSLSP